jgi:hypothetical protein
MEQMDNIRKWLNENGYPLEMKAAQIFRNAGFSVEQSDYYLDTESEAYRELDIVATLFGETDRVHYSMRILVECKVCKDKPWLLFTESMDTRKSLRLTIHPGNELGTQMAKQFKFNKELGTLPILSEQDVTGYALVESMRNSDKKDNTYAALMGLSKGLYAFSKHPQYNHVAGKDICELFLAVTVIKGDLFQAYLDKADAIQLIKIEKGAVIWSNPVCGNRSCAINIVTDSALPGFCQTLIKATHTLWDTVHASGYIETMAGPVHKVEGCQAQPPSGGDRKPAPQK